MLWNKKQEGKMEARPKEQEIVTAVTISEVMVDGLWVIDLQGRTIDVNSAMAKMLDDVEIGFIRIHGFFIRFMSCEMIRHFILNL